MSVRDQLSKGAGGIASKLGAGAASAILSGLRLLPPEGLASTAEKLGGALGPLLPRNHVALENLRHAFPEKSLSECRDIRRKMWKHLFRMVAEGAQADRSFDLSPDNIHGSKIKVRGSEHALALRDDGRPGLVFTAHMGSWELLPLAAARFGLDITSLYRPPNITAFAKLIARARAHSSSALITSRAGAAYELASVLERGGHVGLLVDQKFTQRSKVRVTFFGRPVDANPLLAKLARQFDCPVIGARLVRLADGGLYLDITEPLDLPHDQSGQIDVQGTTALVTNMVESWVREYPEQWLWLHKRWSLF